MRYQGELTIPAGTAKADAVTSTVKVCAGVIREVEIYFPHGHARLTRLTVWYKARQIFPTNTDQYFRGNGTHVTFDENFPLEDAPFELYLVGWAEDSTLEHTVHVEFTIEREAVLQGYTPFVALPEGL